MNKDATRTPPYHFFILLFRLRRQKSWGLFLLWLSLKEHISHNWQSSCEWIS
jgi:hypothetical protein